MSKVVDERVVSMQFDNKHFESNVQTTMSTLDKLKQKLNLTGAAKGLENINTSAKNVNLNPLSNGIETVKAKFSAMEVIGVTALANITNSAVNAGKRLVSSLSIDNVTAGWDKYAEKTSAVQTIMAATAKDFSDTAEQMEYVNSQLDKLNWFTDETSYSFLDMVNNIGKFTSNNISLEKSVTAMQGISTWAAISGANVNEAGRAMYNLSQAISVGSVKLMDWKSIELANMATAEFKEMVIATAEELGTLKKKSDGVWETLKENEVSVSNFNANLGDAWFTSEVLLETLDKYGGFTNKLNEAYEKTGLLTSELLEYTDEYAEGTLDLKKIVKETGMTAEELDEMFKELSSDTYELGRKAFKAAQEAKTFKEALDSVKDAASTTWMNIFETIFGDYLTAKELWTDLANSLYDIFVEPLNSLQEILENVFGKKFGDLGTNFKSLLKPAKNVAESVENVTSALTDLNDIAKKVIRGDFGNGKERFDKLTEAGENYYSVQNKVNELLDCSYRYTQKQIDSQDELLGKQTKVTESTDETTTSLENLTEAEAKQIAELTKLTDEQLRNKGYTDEQIASLRELTKVAEELGMPIEKLLTNLEEIDGRWLFFESFKNIGEYLGSIFKTVGDAWTKVFGEGIDADGISNLITEFYKLTESMEFTEDQATRLTNILEGIFSALDISWSLASVSFMGALKILNEILKLFGTDLGAILEQIALKITTFNKWIEEETIFGSTTKYKDLAQIFVEIYTGIRDCVKAFLGLERVQAVIKRITDLISELFGGVDGMFDTFSLDGVITAIRTLFDNIEAWIKGMDQAENIGLYIIEGIGKGLWAGIKKVVSIVVKIGTALYEAFCSFFDINSPSKLMMTLGIFLINGLILGLLAKNTELGSAITNIGSNMLGWFKSVFSNLGSNLGDFGTKLSEMFKNIDFGKVFSGVIAISMLALLKKIVEGVNLLLKPLTAVSDVLGAVKGFINGLKESIAGLSKAMAFESRTNGIKNIAVSIGVILGAIALMCYVIKKFNITPGELWNAVGVMAAIAVVLAAITLAMSWVEKKLGGFTTTSDSLINAFKSAAPKLISLAASLLLMVWAVKLIADIEPENWKRGVSGLSQIVFALISMTAIIGLFLRGNTFDAKGVSKMLTKLAVSLLLLVWVIKLVGNLDDEEMLKGVVFMGGFALFLLLMGGAAKLGGQSVNEFGSMVLKLVVAMGLLVLVIKLVDKLSVGAMLKGVGFAIAFALFVKLLVWAGKVGEDYYSANIGKLLLSVAVAMLLMVGVCKLAGMLSVKELIKGVIFIGIMTYLIGALILITKIGENKLDGVAKTITSLAIAIGIMAAVCIILGIIDPATVWKGVGAVAALAVLLGGLIFVTKYAQNVVGTIVALTVAIAVFVAAVVALSFVPKEDLWPAVGALAVLLSVFAGLIFVTKYAGKAKNIWGTMLILVGVVTALGGILILMAKIGDPNGAIQSAGALVILLAALMGVLYVLTQLDKRKLKVGKNLLSSLALITGVMVVLGALIGHLSNVSNPNAAIPVAIAITILMGALAGMLYVFSLLDKSNLKISGGIIATLAVLVVVMALIGGIIVHLMNVSNPEKAVPMALGLAAVMLALSVVLLALSAISALNKKMGGDPWSAIFQLATLCGVLALFAWALNKIPMDQIAGKKEGIAVVAATMLAMTVLLLAVSAVGALSKAMGGGTWSAIGGLVVLCGVLALFGWALNAIPMDTIAGKKDGILVTAVTMAAMTVLLLAVSAVGALMKLMGSSGAITGIAGLVVLCGVLALFAWALNKIPMDQIAGKKEGIAVVAATMLAMTVLLLAVSAVGALMLLMGGVGAIAGIAGLIVMCGLLAGFAWALNAIPMDTIAGKKEAIILLTGVMTILSMLLVVTAAVGAIYLATAGIAATGLAGLAIIMGLFAVFALALNAIPMDNIRKNQDMIIMLTNIMTHFVKLLTILAIIGPFALIGVAALAMMETLVLATIAFAGVLGTLNDWTDGALSDFINGGLDIMIKVADGLGQMVGSFIDSALTTATQNLPTIGENLSLFMEKVTPFIEGVKLCDSKMAESVGYLAAAIIKLTVADFINGVASLFGIGGNFKELGQKLFDLGIGMLPFVQSLKLIDASAIDGANTIVDVITALSKDDVMDNFCDIDMETVNAKLTAFGSAITAMNNIIASGVNVESFPIITQGAKAMADTITTLAGTGDLNAKLEAINMESLKEKLVAFGDAMSAFSSAVTTGINVETFTAAKEAGLLMAELEKCAPKEDGLWTTIAGAGNIKSFGERIAAFGQSLIDFQAVICPDGDSIINSGAFQAAKDAGTLMAELENSTPKTDGDWQKIAGVENIQSFGERVAAFGQSLIDFQAVVCPDGTSLINSGAFQAAKDAGQLMSDLQNSLPKQNGAWQKAAGVSDIQTFGSKIEAYASSLISFQNTIAPDGECLIDDNLAQAAVTMGETLLALQNSLPESEGVKEKLSSWWNGGESDLGDFGDMLVELGEAIADFAEETADVNAETLTSISGATKNLVTLLKGLGGIDTEAVDTFKDAVKSLGKAKVEDFYESFSAEKATSALAAVKKIISLIKSMAGLDTSGVGAFKDALSKLGTVEVLNFVKAFSSASTQLAKAGMDMMNGLIRGVNSGKSKVITLAGSIANDTVKKLSDAESKFNSAGKKIMTSLNNGMKDKKDSLKSTVTSAVKSAASAPEEYTDSFKSAGKALGEGLKEGINAKKESVYWAAYALGQRAAQGVKDGEDVNSPSKLTIEYGKSLGEGLIVGIKQIGSSVYKSSYNMGETAANSISGAIARISDVVNSDIDAQPTIRPVLDLTDVTNGASRINSLFNTNRSVGVLANVGAISSMMNSGQNGVNDDIVSAIGDLRKDLSGRTGDTYQINGVTYDDGSNITDAVQTLIRAARIERRR